MYISQITTISENQMIRFHITKPAQEFYCSDTGPEPQIAFSFPDHFLKIGVLDGLTSPSPLAQIRKSEFLIGPFTLYFACVPGGLLGCTLRPDP